MSIFIVVTSYMDSGFFGSYSTVKRARIAFEDFLANDENIASFEGGDDYCYTFTTKAGEQFGAEILWDEVDAEFIEGLVKED